MVEIPAAAVVTAIKVVTAVTLSEVEIWAAVAAEVAVEGDISSNKCISLTFLAGKHSQ